MKTLIASLVLCSAFALAGCAGDSPSAPPAAPDPIANTPDATLTPPTYANTPDATFNPPQYQPPAYTSPEYQPPTTYTPGSYPAPPPSDYVAPTPESVPGGASCGGGGGS